MKMPPGASAELTVPIPIVARENAPRTASLPDDAAVERLLVQITLIARDAAARIVDEDDAEDVAQHIVMDCLIRMREGRWTVPLARLPIVVRRMVLSRTIDGWRARARRRAREKEHTSALSEGVRAWMSPDLAYEDRELRDLHEKALSGIPRVCRRAYVMVRVDELSYEEAAERLGVSPRTVKSHVVRAQRRFREELERVGIQAKYRKRPAGRTT